MANFFVSLPPDEPLQLSWLTPNRQLFDAPERFFARTRMNPDFGRPGWTRECGKRFHRGCDIAPVRSVATGRTTRVVFTDCATGRDFESDEPSFVPEDDVFAAAAGTIHEVVIDETASDFGAHVVLAHRWPKSGETFFTLYAHLAQIAISNQSPVTSGQKFGVMGQTAKSADARNWLAIAPHLHFEVWDAEGNPYNPEEFLGRYLAP